MKLEIKDKEKTGKIRNTLELNNMLVINQQVKN